MLKITTKNQLEALGVFIVHNVITVAVMAYFRFDIGIVLSLGLIALIDSIPTLYLHLQYFEANKDLEFSVGSRAIQIRKSTGEQNYIYSDEIEKITVNMSANADAESQFHLMSMGPYHFARVILKDGRPDVVITNLVTPFVAKEITRLSGVPIYKKIKPFNSIG